MIISINGGKASDKNTQQVGTEGPHLNVIKAIYTKDLLPTSYSMGKN